MAPARSEREGSHEMPIHRLLQNRAFEPDDISALTDAFEQACRYLDLAEDDEAARRRVARKIIELAQTGIRDPKDLFERAVAELTGE